MKRIILQLMSELSTLTSPFNPVDINKIFVKHPPLDPTQVQPEFKKHVEQLLALKALTEQSFDLANQRHYLSSQQERLILLAEEKNTTQQNIDKLLEQMQQNIELVNTSFQQLMPQINENLLKQNKLIPPYSATVDNKTKKIAVEEYHSQLSKSLREMDVRMATRTFVQLKKTAHSLINELSTLGINLSARDGKDTLQKLIPSVALSVNQLKEIKPKMIDLHQLFAKQISGIDVQEKIKELELQMANIEKQLEPIELEISINTLEPKIKDRLSEAFQKSPVKSELIKAYQNKLPSALSYIDPYAWKSWIQDQHKYEVAQLEAVNSVSYLQLLEQEHGLKLDKNRLLDQKKTLGSLAPATQTGNDSKITTLIGQAKILLNECALLLTPISIPSRSSASDFYLALLSYIPIIEQRLEQMAVVLIKLQTLDALEIEIIQLGTQYKFEINSDSLPATQKDFEQLTQLIETQKPAKEVLMQQHELCKSFLVNAAKLEEIKKQLQSAIVHKKDIEKELSVANLATPMQDQISIISEQLSDLRNVIAINMGQISSLPLPSEQPEEQQDSSLEMIQKTTPSLLSDEQLALSVQVSLNLNQSPILAQDSSTEQVFSSDQIVSISKQTLPIEVVEHRQSTSTPSFPANKVHDAQSISPDPIDIDLKPELPLMDEHECLADHSATTDNMIPASGQPLSILKVPDEQLTYIVTQSLKSAQPSVRTEQGREEQLISSDIIVFASNQSLLTEDSQEPESLPVVPISLSSKQLSLPPVSMSLKPDELLAPAQEKPMIQLTPSDKAEAIILTSNQTLSLGKMRDELLSPPVSINLEPEQPLAHIQDKPTDQLISIDKILSASKQSISTKDGSDEQSVSIIPTGLMPDETLTHVQEKSVTELMSSNKIVLGLQQPLSAEKIHDEQLVSSSPHTHKQLVEPLETADDVPLASKISSSIIQPEFHKWQNYYQQSLTYLQYHPIEIQQWYMDLYEAIEVYSNGDDSYKTSHLARDILFELQYKKDLDVIRAYMRLCSNPEKDLNKLLSLKPNLPLVDEPFDEVTELQDSPEELKPLYAQYMKLKKDHPIEGELLLQAIHSLRMAKIFIDTPNSNMSVTQVPSLSKDPRYELLKRHRGFFKVWEAIEDFCRMLIGKIMGQAEFEYTKKPCFFRTKSAQLVEEADLIIQKDLLPICAT